MTLLLTVCLRGASMSSNRGELSSELLEISDDPTDVDGNSLKNIFFCAHLNEGNSMI